MSTFIYDPDVPMPEPLQARAHAFCDVARSWYANGDPAEREIADGFLADAIALVGEWSE